MSARRITRAAVAASAVVAMSAGVLVVGQQSSQAASEADDTLTGRGGQEKFVDVGRSGPSVGDRYVFSENLFDEDKNRVGRLAGSCDVNSVKRNSNGKVKDALQQCVATFRLSDGQITVQGAFWFSDEDPTLAITGGTGDYDDASGELNIDFVNDDRSDYDFDFNNNNNGPVVP